MCSAAKPFDPGHPGQESELMVAIDATPCLASSTGVGEYVRNLVDAIAAVRHGFPRLWAASIRKGAAGALRTRFPGLPVRVTHLPMKLLGPLTDRISWPGLETLLGNADVFHAGPLLVPASRTTAIVSTVYDLTPLRFPDFHLPGNRFTARQLSRRLERAELVIVPSASTARDLRHFEIVREQKVRMIPLAASRFFSPGDTEDLAAISGLGLEKAYILNAGALEPRKNLPRLFEAFKLLKDRHRIPHKLVVAGPRGWKDREIFESVQRLRLAESVILAGYVSRETLRLLYSRAALFVYPSLYEGFGLPPLEAMACGCPVAVSNVSSLPEVVGEAGVYFDPMEVEDIARAIMRILDSSALRAELVESGMIRSGQFSWAKVADSTRAVYREAQQLRRG